MVVDVIFDSLCRCFGAPGNSNIPPDDNIVAAPEKRRAVNFDANAVAHAKLASRPKKRKSTTPTDIFRTRGFEAREKPPPSQSAFSSRFPLNALCFATPIHDDDMDEDNEILRLESDDCNTLNTCEDTVTSTVAFERKYAHLVESRPPMPLFHQFKVNVDKTVPDELRRIVATDSHNSLKMIHYDGKEDVAKQQKVELEEESEDEYDPAGDDDVPPAVKIDSSCSSSSSHRRR